MESPVQLIAALSLSNCANEEAAADGGGREEGEELEKEEEVAPMAGISAPICTPVNQRVWGCRHTQTHTHTNFLLALQVSMEDQISAQTLALF